jgi:trehalose 6-phosphate phosphatase
MLTHALERVPAWVAAWGEIGRLVLLLDFDGTLAPIVDRPELAAMPARTRAALERLMAIAGVEVAIVSGRGMADARERAGIPGIAYAGNHGMEIHGAGFDRVHPQAAAARPWLERALAMLEPAVAAVPGAFVEDKGLTLSVHFRLAPPERVAALTQAVATVVAMNPGLRMTTGKQVLEVRPGVNWDKGKAVLFLLEQMRPPHGAPVLYLGDDRTDEDAFRALAEEGIGEGVLVSDRPSPETAATSLLHDPEEAGALFEALAEAREAGGC